MTELDCDNSQDDSSSDELADCDKLQENVIHDDVQIAIMTVQQQMLQPVVSAPSLSTYANTGTCLIPTKNYLFYFAFAHKEHFMICFGQICADANAPLYVVDKLVKILTEECEGGLYMEDICICRKKIIHAAFVEMISVLP